MALFPGLGTSIVLISGYIAWDQLTSPERIEDLRRTQAETEAKREHVRELMQEYRLIGRDGKKPASS